MSCTKMPCTKILVMKIVLLLSGCSQLLALPIGEPEIQDVGVDSVHGAYHLNTTELRMKAGKTLARLHRQPEGDNGGSSFAEGDIKRVPEVKESQDPPRYDVHPVMTRKRRKAVTNLQFLWPENTVVYDFDRRLPESFRQTIMAAINVWQSNTCLRFLRHSQDATRTVGHSRRIQFYKGAGCSSDIGYTGLEISETSIGDSCNHLGTVAHEIGHSLGFYHEQARNDRDNHVTVFPENIKKGAVSEFNKYDTSKIRTNLPYDIGSVMHYGPTWFSKDGNLHTIEPKHSGMIGVMGQRDNLSFMDIKTANALYSCNAQCGPNQVCMNGGYVGPDCTCRCPPGIAGRSCETVEHGPSGCGGVLRGPSGTFTTPSYPGQYGDKTACHWLIIAGPSQKITLTFVDFEVEDDDNCLYDRLEVRTLGPELAGPRVCGGGPRRPIVYHGESLYLGFQSDQDYSYRGFKATFTAD